MMTHWLSLATLFVVGLFTLSSSNRASANPPPPLRTIEQASEVLDDMAKLKVKCIPPKLLRDAEAVAIIPRVIKAGFVIGGRAGHGLVLTRNAVGGWDQPTFISLGGASFGLQAGVQSTDVILVFKSKDSLDRLLNGKRKLTLGGDASVAAGPVGREVAAGTDAKLGAEIYSYSRARGLFAGVAVQGGVLTPSAQANAEFARDQQPETNQAVINLLDKLHALGLEP